MFSLIITIISIALVVALVAATMYYGGSALNQGTEKADAASFVSGAQQITGAVSLFKSLEGVTPAAGTVTVALLTSAGPDGDPATTADNEKYLSSIPAVKGTGDWTLAATSIEHVVTSEAVCKQLKAKGAGLYDCFGTAGAAGAAGAIGTAPFKFTFNY